MDWKTLTLSVALMLCALVVLTHLWILLMVYMDRIRIQKYMAKKEFEVKAMVWGPFGNAQLSKQTGRFYYVAYEDSYGMQHTTHCFTNMLKGVTLEEPSKTETNVRPDVISHSSNSQHRIGKSTTAPSMPGDQNIEMDLDHLLEENNHLRQENEHLKFQLKARLPGSVADG